MTKAASHTLIAAQDVGKQLKSTLLETVVRLTDDLIGPGTYQAGMVDDKIKDRQNIGVSWARRMGPGNIFNVSADRRKVAEQGSLSLEHYDPLGRLSMSGNVALELGSNASQSWLEWADASQVPETLASANIRIDIVSPCETQNVLVIENTIDTLVNFHRLITGHGGLTPKLHCVLNDRTGRGFRTAETEKLWALCKKMGIPVYGAGQLCFPTVGGRN